MPDARRRRSRRPAAPVPVGGRAHPRRRRGCRRPVRRARSRRGRPPAPRRPSGARDHLPAGNADGDVLELLDDATRSLALAMEGEALEHARREAAALRRYARHPTRAPLVAQPRAPHAAHRHPGLRVDAAPARILAGRRLDRAVPAVDRQAEKTGARLERLVERPARLDRDRVGDLATAASLVRRRAWWSRRPSTSWRRGRRSRHTDADLDTVWPSTIAWSRCSST